MRNQARPGEDWTQVSDLTERRRIQNRIAQRNHRQKLKRLLRKASSGGKNLTPSSKSNDRNKRTRQSSKAPKQSPNPAPPKPITQSFTPPMHHDNEYPFPPSYDERERSYTPPMFSPSYPPPPGEMLMPPCGTAYWPISRGPYPDYLPVTTMPVTLPPITHFSDALKRGPGLTGPDGSLPYLSYSPYIPGVEMSAGAPSPYDQMPHTPPSLSHSYDHSACCSDSGSYEDPTTAVDAGLPQYRQ